jgi:outer membrane receptor protein involved in Fe transport
MPDWTVKLGVGYDNHNGLAASLFYIYTGQPGDPSSRSSMRLLVNPVPRPYHLLSANVNLDITSVFDWASVPHIILNVRMENVLNESLWSPEAAAATNSLPLAPGRGVYGGIIVKF